MIENIVPYGNRIIAEKVDKKDTKVGSIIIPDTTGEKPLYAKVVAVGPGAYNFGTFVPTETKVGDEVLLPKVGSTKFKIENKEYFIIEEHYLLLKISINE